LTEIFSPSLPDPYAIKFAGLWGKKEPKIPFKTTQIKIKINRRFRKSTLDDLSFLAGEKAHDSQM